VQILSRHNGLKAAILFVIAFANTELANSQTVLYKQTALPKTCTIEASALEAKIAELKNVNAQLANKAKLLEVKVAAMKVAVAPVKHRKSQYCKRWKNHKCTWLVRS
jgi:hypothetical protein